MSVPKPGFVVWPGLLAGVMATFVGLGLARFAYTPLIPLLVQAGWFSEARAVYLGEAILLGYLLGALFAYRLTQWFQPRVVVGVCLAAIVLSFVLCSWACGFAWFFAWRLIAGFAGATLIVVVPSMVVLATPTVRRALVVNLIFAGVGLGALLSATFIPLLLAFDLGVTWWSLAALSLVAGVLCWWGLQRMPVATESASPTGQTCQGKGLGPTAWVVTLVLVAYGLDAIGYLPHTVFWVDFIARENGFGQTAGAMQWVWFGVGAMLGPFVSAWLAHRMGWHHALWLGLMIKAWAVLLPLLSLAWLSQTTSSLLVGAMSSGIMALVSGRLAELVRLGWYQRAWGLATAVFAIAQAGAGFLMALLFDWADGARLLFAVGSGVLMLAALLVFASGLLGRRQSDLT